MFKSLAAHVYVPTFHSIPTYFQNIPFQHQIPIAQNQNIDEDFENYQPFDGLGRPKTSIFMCAFKPHNFGVSFLQVIMIANVFTPLK